MPLFFSYLLKLSISLSLVYLFYQFILRRLTFYNWNRFYLFFYTLLSFFIPFINITSVLENNGISNNKIIRLVPAFDSDTINQLLNDKALADKLWTVWDWGLLLLILGALILVIRLFIQLLSFRKIMITARLISSEKIKLYQVNQSIIPFSFGQSIFINRNLHTDEELKDIIRHEIVHVKQKHSFDIIWSEIICIVNWYNPFAWLIRKAIRQNLEFIADNKVLQTGIDKKQYQYLLLKVIGNNHFSIAQNFNFSSLKKRIAMMNKMKSAKLHLLKFLIILPVVIVMLVAFRSYTAMRNKPEEGMYLNVAGIAFDSKKLTVLKDVLVRNVESGEEAMSDELGHYAMQIPAKAGKQKFTFYYSKEGFNKSGMYIFYEFKQKESLGHIQLAGISNVDDIAKGDANPGVSGYFSEQGDNIEIKPGYDLIAKKFFEYKSGSIKMEALSRVIDASRKPIMIIDGDAYVIADGQWSVLMKEQLSGTPGFKVWVDGKIMSMEEVNNLIKRSEIKETNSFAMQDAKKLFNVDCGVLVVSINKKPDYSKLGKPVPELKAEKIKIDTIPEMVSVNSKNYVLGIKNENGKDIVVVKDKNQKQLKQIPLPEWNKKKEYYENIYGKGVDEVIEHAVKESMGLENNTMQLKWEPQDEIYMRPESFERNDIAKIDTTMIIAHYIKWSAEKKQLFFNGKVTLKGQRNNDMTMKANLIMMNTGNFYVILDGKELPLKNDYTSYSKSAYKLISLSKGRAYKKYGEKAKDGAIEIISQD
ncbi:MAG: M56 family metallopeptidase [Bacteroidetes bacterium]|nr:M56 family metallopeptidase [Bacteroidota bacterium]